MAYMLFKNELNKTKQKKIFFFFYLYEIVFNPRDLYTILLLKCINDVITLHSGESITIITIGNYFNSTASIY